MGEGFAVGEGEERIKLAVNDQRRDGDALIGSGPITRRGEAGVVEHGGHGRRVIEEALDIGAGERWIEGGFAG